MSFKQQLKENALAIIGLIVAVIALVSSSWREDITEANRNTRAAGFELLKNLGELQIVVNHSFYQSESMKGNPFIGWGQIALINDLSELLPPSVMEKSKNLIETWTEKYGQLKTSEEAVKSITEKIDADRAAVMDVLKGLK